MNNNNKKYYTLLIKRYWKALPFNTSRFRGCRYGDTQGKWCIEFGDYDLSVVKEEKEEFIYNDTKRKDTKIITTLDRDRQIPIDAIVNQLNSELGLQDKQIRQDLDITKDNYLKLVELKALLQDFPWLFDDNTGQPDELREIDNSIEELKGRVEDLFETYNTEKRGQ